MTYGFTKKHVAMNFNFEKLNVIDYIPNVYMPIFRFIHMKKIY
jgi:hypothetical protein